MKNTLEKPDDLHPVMEDLTHSALGRIIQKAKWLLMADHAMQSILPPEFSPYCHVMNINQSVLILGVSNAAIAMRIRFMCDDLIRELQQKSEFAHIRIIQCRVCTKTIRYNKPLA